MILRTETGLLLETNLLKFQFVHEWCGPKPGFWGTLEVHFFDFILGVIKGKNFFFIGDFFWGVRGGEKNFRPIFATKNRKKKNFLSRFSGVCACCGGVILR